MTDRLNYDAVYRTAPATPGLLITISSHYTGSKDHDRLDNMISGGEKVLEKVISKGSLVCFYICSFTNLKSTFSFFNPVS